MERLLGVSKLKEGPAVFPVDRKPKVWSEAEEITESEIDAGLLAVAAKSVEGCNAIVWDTAKREWVWIATEDD